MKKTIIAITGNKGVGKDTLANLLKDMLPGQVNLFSFAFFLKSITKYLTGLELEEIEYLKRKEDLKIIGKRNVREFLIYLSRIIKDLTKESIFVDKVIEEISIIKPDYAIITDMRFKIEYENLKKYAENNCYDFIVIKLVDITLNENPELEIKEIPYNIIFENNKTKGLDYVNFLALKVYDYIRGLQ